MTIDESKLRQLTQVFLEENKKLNLSAFRQEEHCWVGNVLDSLALLQAFDQFPQLKEIKSLVDVGTGGGFPLMPLALSLPDVKCTGIDATKKKIDAIQRIVDIMGMKNVTLHSDRMEVLAHQQDLRGSFHLATARAVAPINVLLEYCIPFLKVGGLCALWKSTKMADELAASVKAQKVLSAPYVGTFEYDLGETWGKRNIVLFRKTGKTAEDYPRKTGIPKMKPL